VGSVHLDGKAIWSSIWGEYWRDVLRRSAESVLEIVNTTHRRLVFLNEAGYSRTSLPLHPTTFSTLKAKGCPRVPTYATASRDRSMNILVSPPMPSGVIRALRAARQHAPRLE
jgi:hypothetical protein